MTAYNRELYIAEAIESVINSTYQNWELIIVDDCSHDRTVEIARKYEKQDDRIKVYVNEQNLGDYPNRNRAARCAKGMYLKYVDADDLIYPHGLEVMVIAMESYPEAGFALALPASDLEPYPKVLSPRESYMENFLVKPIFIKSPLGAIIKKEAFDQVGGFTGKRMVGDEELWLKLAAKYHLVKMVMGTAFWRKHQLQESKDMSKYKAVRYFINLKMLQSKECPLDTGTKRIALKRYKNGFIRNNIFKQILNFRFRKAIHNKRASRLKFHDLINAVSKL